MRGLLFERYSRICNTWHCFKMTHWKKMKELYLEVNFLSLATFLSRSLREVPALKWIARLATECLVHQRFYHKVAAWLNAAKTHVIGCAAQRNCHTHARIGTKISGGWHDCSHTAFARQLECLQKFASGDSQTQDEWNMDSRIWNQHTPAITGHIDWFSWHRLPGT